MPFIDTTRMRFFYRSYGQPDGLPMLLLHGSFGSSRWWEPFCQVLPDEIHAIAPDLRGCGQSEKSADGYAIQEQADDLHALVTTLELDEFDLVGHSSSGAIAVEYALAHMPSLHSLILVDSAPLEGVHTPLEGYRLLEQMRCDPALLRRALASLMPTKFTADPVNQAAFTPFFDQLVADAAQMAPAAFTAVAQALERWDRCAAAARLTLPSLIVWGEADSLVEHSAAVRTLLAIPGANNLEVLRAVGHSPMIEAPVGLAERIIDFIAEDYAAFDELRQTADEP